MEIKNKTVQQTTAADTMHKIMNDSTLAYYVLSIISHHLARVTELVILF